MNRRVLLNGLEALLRKATSWLVVLAMFLAIAQALSYFMSGPGGAFIYLNATIAMITMATLVYAGFCAIRYRSVLAAPNLTPLALLALAPVVTTGGQWQAFLPNIVLVALAGTLAIGQKYLAPRSRTVGQRTRVAPQEYRIDHLHQPKKAVTYQFPAVRPKYSFAAVSGMSDVKGRLLEAGREVAEEQKRLGQIVPRNGILLFGLPGNGKTFFAEALAGELGLPMVSVTFGDVASQWVNRTTEQIMQAFKDARAQSPCLLFIDEIDSLIRDRNASMAGGTDEAAKTTNALLTELVKIRESMVVVVAATNFLDKLDQAAIREGRFDFKVEITPPDELARAALIRTAVAKHQGIVLAPEAEAMAAHRWRGFSVARVRTVADEACRAAHKAKRTRIEYVHMQEALRAIQGRKGSLPEDTPEIADLSMMPSQKQRLMGIATRMRDIEKIEEMGGTVPTGLLFWGPPGTGKTVTARALAKTSGWAFLSASGNDLLGNPDRVEKLASEAQDIRPCIVFIDEADDVLADRRYAPHSASVTNKLLTAIDGAGGKVADVVWVAATNHPENMDAAALRGGRFTEKVEFAIPAEPVIAEFARKWMERSRARFDRAVTPAAVAEILVGLSIANVSAVLQQAVDLMVERRVTTSEDDARTTLEDVAVARDSVLAHT